MYLIERLRYWRHWRWQAKAKSLALPIARTAVPHNGNLRLGVVLHLFYPDLADDFAKYLRNIDQPFDLMITTDTVEKKRQILRHPVAKIATLTKIRLTPNRGRDIAPKVIAYAKDYKSYDLLLFLHSKRSPHAVSLANWRIYLLEQLLGSRAIVSNIVDLFAQVKDLGIVAPRHFDPVSNGIEWGANYEDSKAFAARFGVSLGKPTAPMDFPSGSMFWARPQALQPILDLNLSIDDFELENGQVDGTLAHRIERLFYFACEKSGHSWVTVANCETLDGRENMFFAKDFDDAAKTMRSDLLS